MREHLEMHQIKVDEVLLGELRKEAAKQNKSVDQVVNEALTAHLREAAWTDLLDEARARTQHLGIREEDVEDLIAQHRKELARGI